MSDTEDDFGETGSINSDTDVDSEHGEMQEGNLSADEDVDMPEIGEVDDADVSELLSNKIDVKVEPEKSKHSSSIKKRKTSTLKSDDQKLSKKAMNICAVPGCKSRFLLTVGVKLSSFQVPQPTDPKYNKVWLKWLHALGFSSSEEGSKTCSNWARICELHFSEDCFVKDWEHQVLGKKPRAGKRLLPGSFPTLNVSVPEEVLEDPRLLFHLDPIIGEKHDGKLNPSKSHTISEEEKVRLKSKIIEEAEIRVQQELAKPDRGSVIPNFLSELNKGEYDRRVRSLISSVGIKHPPSFIDDLHRKLGVPRDVVPRVSRPKPAVASPAPSSLPPCTILRPVAKEGEPPLPAILLPGLDNANAVKLLEDPNIQELLKKMAEKHKEEMAKKMLEEGDEEEEEFINEDGETVKRMKKKEIPAPPMIILQATDPSAPKPPEIPDIVQQAIDKTFNLPNQPMSQTTSTGTKTGSAPRTKGGPSVSQPRPPPRWAHQKFLDSLPPIDSKFVLNDEGNIVTMSSVDHDYGQAGETNGIPIFDPTGLRQEVEMWRMEVETLRRKNYELKMRLSEGRYNRKASQSSMKIGFKSVEIDRKKFEKLELSNRKLQEELVRLKLERRRMMNKERNRKRKRQKVLERRQKRRDWIMEQIELGNMTKEHLELVYSRKKLPYEKKNGAPTTTINNETMTLITIPGTSKSELVEEGAARSNPEVMVKQRRGRQNIRNSQQNINDDLSGMTSVVVTTSDVQHHDLSDENVVAVSGIPGVVISSGGMHSGTHQIIVEGGSGEEYTHEQIDFIVKAVDDMEANGWKVASPRHFQRQHY